MTSHVCSEEEWTSKTCCYSGNQNENCDRDVLIAEGSRIADFWYVTKQECKDTDFDLVNRIPGILKNLHMAQNQNFKIFGILFKNFVQNFMFVVIFEVRRLYP